MSDDNDDPDWPASLGIVDTESGRRLALESREALLDIGRAMFRTGVSMQLAGMLTRVQSLHEGAVQACEATNPHAAFTLLRALAEQCAAMEFVIDKPEAAEALWSHEGYGVSVGKLMNHAKRSGRTDRFGDLYDVLSKYAHPSAMSLWAGWRVENDETREVSWSSAPRFKSEVDELTVWGWVFELTTHAAKLMQTFMRAGDPDARQR